MGATQVLRGFGCSLIVVVACACGRFGEAGTTAGSDGGDTSADDDGGGGVSAEIRCAGAFCRGGQVCCITSSGGELASAACTTKDACATTHYECDDTTDCASGQICCASTNGGSYFWASASCQAACTGSQRQLCATTAECTTGSCTPNPQGLQPPGLSACK